MDRFASGKARSLCLYDKFRKEDDIQIGINLMKERMIENRGISLLE